MDTELESSLLVQELRCSRGVVEGSPVLLALNLTLWLEEGNGMPLTERETPQGSASLAWDSTSMHRPWQAGPEPSSFCPWQGLAASVRLMKPSGCDTISSKLGREPLPVPVREGGRVPINKTILESQRKSLFCSHPPVLPNALFL